MAAIEWFFSLSHLEGCRHDLLLSAWDSKSLRMFFPSSHGFLGLLQNRFRRLRLEPEVWGDFQRQIEAQRIVGFGDVEAQSGTIGIGIQIVGGRENPSAPREQEAVVTTVIVGVMNGDGENDASSNWRVRVPSPDVAGKILDADFQNVVRKVAAGRPLTVAERSRIEARAAGRVETLAMAWRACPACRLCRRVLLVGPWPPVGWPV